MSALPSRPKSANPIAPPAAPGEPAAPAAPLIPVTPAESARLAAASAAGVAPPAPAPHAPGGSAACETCPAGAAARLKRMGAAIETAEFTVALLGNPNVGKSTVFNALTGLRQHVGNWTGKTVSRAEGAFRLRGRTYRIVDLPGCYSLVSSSHHEEIARDFVLFGRPDVTVVVLDATRLERNLILALQTLEITGRVVVGVNLMDEARRNGIEVDTRALARRLGAPVVPMAARQGEGVAELLDAIEGVATGRIETRPYEVNHRDPQLESVVRRMTRKLLDAFPGLPAARWVALRLLDQDHSILQAIRDGSLGDMEKMEAMAMPRLNREELKEET